MNAEEFYRTLRDTLLGGDDFELCTILTSTGFTPRGSGAKMAVFGDGSTVGTIGGGPAEYECAQVAKDALLHRAAFTRSFGLSPDRAAEAGMICGGEIVVDFRPFLADDPPVVSLFQTICELFEAGKDAWLVLEIGGAGRAGLYEREAGLLFMDSIPEGRILPLLGGRGVLAAGDPPLYVEPVARAGFVYVFGGGHVSRELVPLLVHVGFRVRVYEDREAFAAPALFPGAVDTMVCSFSDIGTRVKITGDDCVVIVTRGHQADYEVLYQALATDAYYVGMMGSRQKIAATFARLVESGVPEAMLSRVHTPIGLAILAETPAEIAVSIAAEMIKHRAERRR